MFSIFAFSAGFSGFNRYRQSLLSGFRTFLPLESGTGDVFIRSNS